MAPSSPPPSSYSSGSRLNSTCALFSVLDLSHNQTQNMGDMNTDLLVDVPDTPDRLLARPSNKGKCVWKETHSSDLNNSDPFDGKRMNGFRGIGRLVNENDHKRNHVMSRKNHIFNDFQDRGKSIDLSSPENSHASPEHHYRRVAINKASDVDKGQSSEARSMNNIRSKIMSKHSYLAFKKQDDHGNQPEMVSENGASRVFLTENVEKDPVIYGHSSSILYVLDSPKQSFHGKEKVTVDTSQDLSISMVHRKVCKNSIDAQHKLEKQVPEPHCTVASTRTSGRKRLVRNGCISPHNIAMRAKQFAKHESDNSKFVPQSMPGNMVSPPTSCLLHISDIASEGIHMNKDKGKGVVVHPSTLADFDTRNIGYDLISKSTHESDSNTAADTGTDDAIVEAAHSFEELGGWRSARHRSVRIDHPFSDALSTSPQMISNNTRRCDNEIYAYGMEGHDIAGKKGQNIQKNCTGNTDANQRDFRLMSNLDQTTGPNGTESTLNKRQKKRGLASINNSKCHVSDIICLDSPGESSNSRSSRIQSRQSRSGSVLEDPVVGVDESSPGTVQSVSGESDCPINYEFHDARARQLEADEKLARELQEQLYHELPYVGFSEFDENLALALQQEEESSLASSDGIRSIPQARSQSMVHSRRPNQSQAFQIASNRTGTQRRPSNYSRVNLRSRFSRSSSRISSRERNLCFPLDMDLDMRVDILEALEAAVGDDTNANETRVASPIFQPHEDNDPDYAWFLAHYVNEHGHTGATVNQINTLPQSTVQTENLEEACAVCLDIPAAGDIIRHLPCFHKFHKDCIDPWLRRRRSCPVCKFSIA